MKCFNLSLVGAVGVALSAFAAEFPYGVEEDGMAVRFQADSVRASSLVLSEVPTVDGGMPQEDSLVRAVTRTIDFAATDADHWDELVASFSDGAQFALALKDDGGLKWMCYSAGEWIELDGPVAAEGDWLVKVEIDYSQPESERVVRYGVSADGGENYVCLKSEGLEWIPLGVNRARLEHVGLVGYGELGPTVVKSARRPMSGEITLVENVSMDYNGLLVRVSVEDGWGVEGADASVVLRNRSGAVVGTVSGVIQDGRMTADFSNVASKGEEYSCEVTLSKDDVQGLSSSSEIKLFADVDWFGFDEGSFVHADPDGLIVITDGAFGTAGTVGRVMPQTESSNGAETVVEARVSVNGVCQQDDLPNVTAQFAILPMRLKNVDMSVLGDRCWAVKDGNGLWTPIASSGVSADNGEYDIRVALDYRDGHRIGSYWIRPMGEADYVKLAEFALAEERLQALGVMGGCVSSLNAAYKTTSPIDVKPDERSSEIVLQGNANLDLTQVACKTYEVKSMGSVMYHIRWVDEKIDDATRKFAKMDAQGMLTVKTGMPANGLESFNSYALGLDPTKALDKPAAVVKADGHQSADGITVHVPNVMPSKLPDAGVEVVHQLQKSTDGGKTWTDDGAAVSVGGDLKIPFDGNLYRVNTVLK